jgi:hypothetical protein
MSVCPSVCMIQLENHWTDLDEIMCELYANGAYSEMVLAHWIGQSPLSGAEPPRATALVCLGGRCRCDVGLPGVCGSKAGKKPPCGTEPGKGEAPNSVGAGVPQRTRCDETSVVGSQLGANTNVGRTC